MIGYLDFDVFVCVDLDYYCWVEYEFFEQCWNVFKRVVVDCCVVFVECVRNVDELG